MGKCPLPIDLGKHISPGAGGGGRFGINHARMCVSRSEGYGSLFSFK